jgi:hypothetical protein
MVKAMACSVFAMALLAGCSETPLAAPAAAIKAVDVPPARQLLFRRPAPGTAQVVVIREPNAYGVACTARIFVNGKVAAYLDAGEKVTLHIPAGRVVLAAEPYIICGPDRVEMEAKLQAGQRAAFRISRTKSGPRFYPAAG